ncbi:unnamed protein product [Microthlaspi erraticum]|uniref:Uncharacterized protein n=1 Tax=Microthlaspi erraticum TaxID=1685480 RepID=A0A6D2J3F9_9BRAS|nr:unnamed protein product [Microthlaspi erraticum]CAA7050843.1 unnamed protein product [Microthlaspi erraticum]
MRGSNEGGSDRSGYGYDRSTTSSDRVLNDLIRVWPRGEESRSSGLVQRNDPSVHETVNLHRGRESIDHGQVFVTAIEDRSTWSGDSVGLVVGVHEDCGSAESNIRTSGTWGRPQQEQRFNPISAYG